MVSSVMKVHSDTCHCVMTETLTLSLLINEHLFLFRSYGRVYDLIGFS